MKLLVIQVAALGWDMVRQAGYDSLCGMPLRAMPSVYPALTCTFQAAFRTGTALQAHGMPMNGFMDRDLRRVYFWEQSSALVQGERIWSGLRKQGGKVAVLFWQQSLGEAADKILSPAPVHCHGGGMIQSVYSVPDDLYGRLSSGPGGAFQLRHYWGPLASVRASDWIARATQDVLADTAGAPDLCLTYLPGLDYDMQRYGPAHPRSARALRQVWTQMEALVQHARRNGYEVLVAGDYAIGAVDRPVYPNRALRQAGLLHVRQVRHMAYPDFHRSPAFCVVDHEVGHVYLRKPKEASAVRDALAQLPGIGRILGRDEMAAMHLWHPRCGDLMIEAAPGAWLAYPWWEDAGEAPDYATHVDIHNKPGYDPAELFFGRFPWQVSVQAERIRGSHGRGGEERKVAWASSLPVQEDIASLAALTGQVEKWLGGMCP